MNPSYTDVQLSAMTALAIYASAADGHIDECEKNVILGHLAVFVPDETKRAKLIDAALYLTLSYNDAVAIVRTMSMSQKRHFCAFIALIILVDGNITNRELEFWTILTEHADLPLMSLEQAVKILADENGIRCPSQQSSASGNSGCCLVIAIPLILVMLITMSVSYLA